MGSDFSRRLMICHLTFSMHIRNTLVWSLVSWKLHLLWTQILSYVLLCTERLVDATMHFTSTMSTRTILWMNPSGTVDTFSWWPNWSFKSAWHDPQDHPLIFFSNLLWYWYQKFYIFLTFVVKFDVHFPNNLGEINGNVAWKLEHVVTTLNKTINNISIIFYYYFQRDIRLQLFHFGEIFRWKLALSARCSKIIFWKFSCRHL